MAQMVFFDLSDRDPSLDAKKDPPVEINDVVPREEFRAILEKVWRKPDSARKFNAGRKLMDAALMFKTLVPGALYNLSDDQVEYQVRDRLSFLHYPTVVCPANHCRAMDNALAETINGLYKAEAEENYYAQKADPDMIA